MVSDCVSGRRVKRRRVNGAYREWPVKWQELRLACRARRASLRLLGTPTSCEGASVSQLRCDGVFGALTGGPCGTLAQVDAARTAARCRGVATRREAILSEDSMMADDVKVATVDNSFWRGKRASSCGGVLLTRARSLGASSTKGQIRVERLSQMFTVSPSAKVASSHGEDPAALASLAHCGAEKSFPPADWRACDWRAN